MGFAEPGRPRISPQGRAPPCASVGGYMKRPCGGVVRFTLGASTRQPSRVVQSHFIRRRSCVVPYGLPGYRRLRRAPPLHPPPPRRRGISEESSRRKGIPRVRRGLGSVG